MLQAKHFDENGQLRLALHPDLMSDQVSEKHLLKAGDVLFAAKGTKNFAALYESHNPPCVASTSFFVIRLQDPSVMPEYLVWFLNHPNTQAILKAQAIGTSIVSISKSVLQELEIPIPPLQTQNAILKISQLHNKARHLRQQIDALKEQLLQEQIFNALQ